MALGWLVYSCARQSAPVGGPVDKDPPVMLQSQPSNGQLNFTGNELIFKFNEYVVLKEPKKEIMISPPISGGWEQEPKGKGFLITWDEDLEPNTTYTISFGGAITDLHEGNASKGLHAADPRFPDSLVILTNLHYVFSTGSQIDTLTLVGTVQPSNSDEVEGILVGLYETVLDSIPMQQTPKHITKTDKKGNFVFHNLPAKPYEVIAFKDNNTDFKLSTLSETYGFSAEQYVPGDTVGPRIRLFRENLDLQYIKSAEWLFPGYLQVILNKPCTQYELTGFNVQMKKAWQIFESSERNDTIAMWSTTGGMPDTLSFTVIADEFTDKRSISTQFEQKSGKSKKKGKKPTSDSLLQIVSRSFAKFQAPSAPLTLKFSQPVSEVSQDNVQLKRDTVVIRGEWKSTQASMRKYQFSSQLTAGKYSLSILPNAFNSVYAMTTDTLNYTFEVAESEQLGEVLLQMEGSGWAKQQRVYLRTVGNKLLNDTITGSSQLTFGELEPGNYLLQALVDENADGYWTAGSYGESRQPELLLTYPDTIKVQADFSTEVLWTLLDD